MSDTANQAGGMRVGRRYCVTYFIEAALNMPDAELAKVFASRETGEPINAEELRTHLNDLKWRGLEMVPVCDAADPKTGRCMGHPIKLTPAAPAPPPGEPSDKDQIAARVADRLVRAVGLLRTVLEVHECECDYDHNGFCQEHCSGDLEAGEKCWVAQVREFIAELEGKAS